MKRFGTLILFSLVLFTTTSLLAESITYTDAVLGRSCYKNSTGSLECVYKIGYDLVISIVGVGESNAEITVFKSSGREGDYYPTFGMFHGCVIVKPGKKSGTTIDYAFISPKNGKVYRDWTECGKVR